MSDGVRSLEDRITALVEELTVALVNTRIYWSGHPRVRDAIARTRAHLEALTGAELETLALEVDEDGLLFAGERLVEASVAAATLVRRLCDRGAGGVEFHARADATDLAALLEMLADDRLPAGDLALASASLASHGCRWVRVVPPGTFASEASKIAGSMRARLPSAGKLHQDAVEVLQDATISASLGQPLSFEAIGEIAVRLHDQLRGDPGSMLASARYEHYDTYTFGHTIRVALLAMLVGDALSDDIEMVERIGAAALLHDIGKVRLPFEIVHSQEWLTADERRELMKHTIYGAEILLGNEGVDPLFVGVAFGHHMAFNGRGYPRTLLDEPVSQATRIVKICDVFEALTGARPYRAAMSPTVAFRTMLAMRDHFDLGLLRTLIEVHGAFPVGSRVRLSTGPVVSVVRQSADLGAPVVRLDAGGDARELDLSEIDRVGPVRLTTLLPAQAST